MTSSRSRPRSFPHTTPIFRRQACLNVFDSLWFSRFQAPQIIPGKAGGPETLKKWVSENIDGSLRKAKSLLAIRITSEVVRDYSRQLPPSAGKPTFFDLWSTSPDLEPIRETGWGAYQAVAAYLTHHYLHEDPDWWLIEDDFAFQYLADASYQFQAQAKDIPFHAWNRETGSYERKR